jgi:hypothetical protein
MACEITREKWRSCFDYYKEDSGSLLETKTIKLDDKERIDHTSNENIPEYLNIWTEPDATSVGFEYTGYDRDLTYGEIRHCISGKEVSWLTGKIDQLDVYAGIDVRVLPRNPQPWEGSKEEYVVLQIRHVVPVEQAE